MCVIILHAIKGVYEQVCKEVESAFLIGLGERERERV